MSTIQIKDGAAATKYYNVIEAGTSSEPHEPVIPPYGLVYAIQRVLADDSVTVSVQEKAKSLLKFGDNPNIGTSTETVWYTGGMETYLSANSINKVVSSSASDTQDVIIEGHTISGSDFTFVTQTATLNGSTEVTLSTPLARVQRMYNDDNADFVGAITVLIGSGATYLTIPLGTINQTTKCAFTTASDEYIFITSFTFSCSRNTTAKVDFNLQIRLSGKVFRDKYKGETTDTNGTKNVQFEQYMIIPPNSDVRLCAISSAATTEVWGAIHGYYAVIT